MRQSFSTQPALFALSEMCDHPALCALDEVEALVNRDRIVALLRAGEEKALT